MFKKSIASIVTAAFLVAGPGNPCLSAAAQTIGRAPVTGVSVTPTIGAGLNAPSASFNAPVLTPSALNLTAPSLLAAPSLTPAPAAGPVQAQSAVAAPSAFHAEGLAAIPAAPLAVIQSKDAAIPAAAKAAALDTLFDASVRTGAESLEVMGQLSAPSASGLERADVVAAKSEKAKAGGSVLLGVTIGAGAVAVAAAVSSPFRNLLKRLWNVTLGRFGMLVKIGETPEVLAERVIQQLDAARPVYNQKVADASTLVEKLKQQIRHETEKVAELEQGITALLSDSDTANDIQASGMINQQKTLNASIAATKEQLALGEANLANIKHAREVFFAEREETLAKISAQLNTVKAARINEQIAKLKGDFELGGLKDNMDKLDQAVDDAVAKSKGTVDSVESNPDQILKKAKDSLKSQEIQDEIAKRKAAIEQAKKDKGQAGGKIAGWQLAGAAMGAIVTAVNPVTSLVIVMALGVLTLVDDLSTTKSGKRFANLDKSAKFYSYAAGSAIAVLGLLVLSAPAYLTAFAAVATAVSAVLGLVHGKIHDLKSKDDGKGEAGGLLLEIGIAAGVIALVAAVSKPFRSLLARLWNVTLGRFGMLIKSAETPEVLAQRIIDQLNEQKPVYNRKVQEASTLVESLRLQIEKQEKQSAELDRSVTAILSDSDPLNDVMAESLLNQKKTVDASTAKTKEQIEIAAKGLESIKQERARFFAEREEMLAKISERLNTLKAAQINEQIAKLKGDFEIGGLKDNMDKLDQAVDDAVAKSKGTVDSVESNPDQILKKAKESLKNQEVQDEIARRKAAIEQAKKDKGQAGGAVNDEPTMSANQAEAGILSKTYSWMTLGLGITAAAAQASIITGAAAALAASLPLLIGVIVAQFALVIGLSLAINKLSPGAALGGFLLYSALNGLFLAPVVAMFTAGSVAASFLVTAGMFGAMALIGHTTKKNLNSIGSYGMMALVGIILASFANMFLHSTGLDAILTYATIVVFVGLTAFDAQRIKEMAQQQGRLTKDDQSRVAVMGALTLYLDFINLFIQILKIMGKAKSKD